MEAITSAVKSVVSAIIPKKNSPALQTTKPNQRTEVPTIQNSQPTKNTNTNTNTNNNNKSPNVRFEPGNRQNVYSSFQSSSAEGGSRKKRRHTKKHRKSKKRMTRRS